MVLQAFVPVHAKVNGKAIGHTVTLQEKVSCIFQSLITYQNWNFKSFLDFLPWQSCGISGLWPVGPCNKTRTPCVRSRMLRTHISFSLLILQKTAVTDKSYNCLTYKSWNNNETNTLVNLNHKNFKRGNLDYMEANSVGHLPIWTSNTSR